MHESDVHEALNQICEIHGSLFRGSSLGEANMAI